jgi:hypothetical protein
MLLGKLPNGVRGVGFFTSKDNPHLVVPYGGIPFESAIQMVASVAGADGVVIESKAGDWVSIVNYILEGC